MHHDYWAYWIVLPLALGLGTMADVAVAAAAGRRALAPVAPILSAAALGLAGLGVLAGGGTGEAVSRGAAGGRLLQATAYPSTQATARYLGDLVQPASWVSYGARRPAIELVTHGDVVRLAASDPGDLVLVHAGRLRRELQGPPGAEGCRAGVPPGRTFASRDGCGPGSVAGRDRARLRHGAGPRERRRCGRARPWVTRS